MFTKNIPGLNILLFLRAVVGISFYCEYGWLRHGSRCYKRFVGDTTGYDARSACQQHGAFLASIKDANVQYFLQTNVMSTSDTWIGGTDEGHEGTWVWSHSEDTFTYSNWNSGEPNNAKGDEDCLEIYGQLGYRWNDCPCNGSNNGYICLKGGIHFIYKKIVVGHLTLF
ncbi:perlucin-like protein [Crassostrea virginica]